MIDVEVAVAEVEVVEVIGGVEEEEVAAEVEL